MHLPVNRHWRRIGLNTLIVVWSLSLIVLLMGMLSVECEFRRHHMARAQLRGLAAKIEAFHEHTGNFPATLDVLTSLEGDGPHSTPAELKDPWGAAFYYRANTRHGTFRLFTLGADGRPGGVDEALDIDAADVAISD